MAEPLPTKKHGKIPTDKKIKIFSGLQILIFDHGGLQIRLNGRGIPQTPAAKVTE